MSACPFLFCANTNMGQFDSRCPICYLRIYFYSASFIPELLFSDGFIRSVVDSFQVQVDIAVTPCMSGTHKRTTDCVRFAAFAENEMEKFRQFANIF